MKFKKVTIQDYRSIKKLELPIDEHLTTLVGANEHGKSNILEAIAMLDVKRSFDFEKDKRIDNNAENHYPSIIFSLELSDLERRGIQEESQEKYPPQTITNTDGTVSEGKPEKKIKLEDIPSVIEYKRYIGTDENEEEKNYYTILNISDQHIRDTIYLLIKEKSNTVIYFDEFNDRLGSVISREEIENSDQNPLIQGLLKISGFKGSEEELFTDTNKSRQLWDKAPKRITEEIKKAWYQGQKDDIQVKVKTDTKGENILIDVEDKNTFVEFGSRSRGFKWFFSFFLKYRAHHDGDLKDSIFIIDEPGLFLHPKGQKDLLQYLDKLGIQNQIIYSTHSPFMINRSKPNRVRVVEKSHKNGTEINTKGFTANWRHMRTALGMVLSDSFYYADKTLVVEGPEDVIYILSLLQFIAKKEKWNIDVNILSVMDAGSASNLPAMARIVKDEERPLIVLIDSDSTKMLNRLKKILAISEYKEVKEFNNKAVTIQDLLPKKIYEMAVNKYIQNLVKEKDIILLDDKSDKYEIPSTVANKLDKDVEKFVLENFNEDSVSKVGIAREFEFILGDEGADYDEKEFSSAKLLIEWVIKTLMLKV